MAHRTFHTIRLRNFAQKHTTTHSAEAIKQPSLAAGVYLIGTEGLARRFAGRVGLINKFLLEIDSAVIQAINV